MTIKYTFVGYYSCFLEKSHKSGIYSCKCFMEMIIRNEVSQKLWNSGAQLLDVLVWMFVDGGQSHISAYHVSSREGLV